MQITVSIYGRVKINGKWMEKHVSMPNTMKDGKLFVKDQREGNFIISWYEDCKKKRQAVEGHDLSDAVALARSKAWYLNNCREHPEVKDPTATTPRPRIEDLIPLYLEAKSGCPRTKIAHKRALQELQNFCAVARIGHVDEITKPLVRKWFDKLVAGGNSPLTAGIKVLRMNAFYRAVLHLDPGKGIITKHDYKRELKNVKTPEIYTRQELELLLKQPRGHDNPDNDKPGDDPMIQTLAGRIYRAEGMSHAKLAEFYRAAVQAHPLHRALAYDYAEVLIEGRRYDEALKLLDARITTHPNDVRLYELQARTYAALDKPQEEHHALAYARISNGDLRGAIEQLELAKQSGSNYYQLAVIDNELKEFREVAAAHGKK